MLPGCIFAHVNGVLEIYPGSKFAPCLKEVQMFCTRMQICTAVYFGHMNAKVCQID